MNFSFSVAVQLLFDPSAAVPFGFSFLVVEHATLPKCRLRFLSFGVAFFYRRSGLLWLVLMVAVSGLVLSNGFIVAPMVWWGLRDSQG